jgi:DNA mismatch endonuclease (patch repair protein)
MADIVSPEQRSRMMSGIRGKGTKPEALVRKALTVLGYRYRLHRPDLPGSPDIAMPGRKIAIFAQGCFWHMHQSCCFAKMPSTRPDFWRKKLTGNAARDQATVAKLISMGWRALWVWECALRDAATLNKLPSLLQTWIEGEDPFGEIAGPRSVAVTREVG